SRRLPHSSFAAVRAGPALHAGRVEALPVCSCMRSRQRARARGGGRRHKGIVGYRGAPMTTVHAQELQRFLRGFDQLYGLELLAVSDTVAQAQVVVRDELKQGLGLVHGGVYASLAESIASIATAVAV